jgi:hypothetical protein
MKKTLTILSLILAVSFLAGCGKKVSQNQIQNQNQTTVQNQEKGPATGGVINSIKDAMNLGKKTKCIYTMGIGDQSFQTEMYIDGKNHKTITTINGKKNYSVLDGDMIYNWSEADKKGTKMSMKCIEELKTQTKTNTQAPPVDAENLKTNPDDFNDAMNVKCEEVSLVDFTIPNDVVFTDTCETMKKSLEMMNQVKTQMPTQVPTQIPPGAFPEGASAQ